MPNTSATSALGSQTVLAVPYARRKEILHPVAIVIFGGLVTSTLLDTLLTPVLFLRYGAKPLEHLSAVQAEFKVSEAY